VPTLAEVAIEARDCVACPLARTRTTVVFGVGNESAELMLVGEAPGRDEDLQGEPFVGRSGKLLDRLLAEELGIDRSSCYIANVIKCRPPDNRDPLPLEVETCRHFLDTQIELIDPKVVITLGNFAMRALLQTKAGVSAMRGQEHPFGSRVLVPTYHPAAALRSGGVLLAQMRADFVRAKRHLTS
jgi:DNA polymerase